MEPYVANWRDKSLYPDRGCEDITRIAWEFLRRNRQYAEHFQQLRKLPEEEFHKRPKKKSESQLEGLECWPAALPAETVREYYARLKNKPESRRGKIDSARNSLLNRWALGALIDPANDYDPAVIEFVRPRVKLKRSPELETKRYGLFLYGNEAAIRFRLDIRVADQLVEAKMLLDAAAMEYNDTLRSDASQAKNLPKNLVTTNELRNRNFTESAHYLLRCYDARMTGGKTLGDKKRRTAIEAGEAELLKVFRDEVKEEKPAPPGRKTFSRGITTGWFETADAYINRRKFLTLL